MIFFYDKQILIKKISRDKYLVYSPLINKRLRVNKSFVDFLRYVIKRNGRINLLETKNYFSKLLKENIDRKEIIKNINILKQLEILFNSQNEIITADRKVKSHINEILNNQRLKTAYLHLTMRCNFECIYCYNRDIELFHRNELDTNKWLKILESLSQAGIKTLNITGGEPLIRPDIDLIIRKAKEYNFTVSLLTNGSLLLDKYGKIVPYIDKLFLSIDSNDININSKNRSKTGFSNILQLIKKCAKDFPEKLIVRSVITKNNIDDVKKFHDFLKQKYNVNNLLKVLSIPNNIGEIEKMPTLNDIKRIPPEETEVNYKYVICGAGRSTIAIAPNGDIYPCQMLMYEEFKMGNVLCSNWFEIVQDNKINISPIFLNKNTKCANCVYKYYCGGGCPGISYKLYKNFNTFLGFLCPYMKEEAKRKILYKKSEWKELEE